MSKSIAMNDILKSVASLPLEEQDYIVQTISKRIHEARRKEIAQRTKEAEDNYQSGNVKKGSVDDLMGELGDG